MEVLGLVWVAEMWQVVCGDGGTGVWVELCGILCPWVSVWLGGDVPGDGWDHDDAMCKAVKELFCGVEVLDMGVEGWVICSWWWVWEWWESPLWGWWGVWEDWVV